MGTEAITHEDAQAIRQQLAQAQASELRSQARAQRAWVIGGVLLGSCFFLINGFQAGWALQNFTALGGGSELEKAAVWLIGFGLIAMSNIMLIRFTSGGFFYRMLVMVMLAGLVGLSVTTSGLHIATKIQGGQDTSIKSSKAYLRAEAAYERAVSQLEGVERSAALADEAGKTSDAGWIRAKHVPKAQERVDAALAELKSTMTGNQGTEATVLASVAGKVGMTPTEFAVVFSWVIVVMMEAARLMLTISGALALGRLLNRTAPVGKVAANDAPPRKAQTGGWGKQGKVARAAG